MAAAEGNFDFQEIASFLPVPLFFFSANQQKENFPPDEKRDENRMNMEKRNGSIAFPPHPPPDHAITPLIQPAQPAAKSILLLASI